MVPSLSHEDMKQIEQTRDKWVREEDTGESKRTRQNKKQGWSKSPAVPRRRPPHGLELSSPLSGSLPFTVFRKAKILPR